MGVMSKSGIFPVLALLAVLAVVAGFFGGMWVQDLRSSRQRPGGDLSGPADDVVVRPIPELTTSGRVVAGFEHQEALLLGLNGLLKFDPQALVKIVEAIGDRTKLIGVVASNEEKAQAIALLKANHLPETSIDFFRWPVESPWLRFYAPYFMVGEHTTVLDFTYAGKNHDIEDAFAPVFAASFKLHYSHCGLTFDGGDLLTNGDGVCITTPGSFNANAERGYDDKRVGEILHDQFHFQRWVRLEPLPGEPTGHAGAFVTICAKNKAIMGIYRREDDPAGADALDANAGILNGEATSSGPMEVVRIPMPGHADGVWRTYTNVIYANGVVLVPQFPDFDPKLDALALEVFRSAMPSWNVVGIDSSKLVANGGGLHRASRAVPSLGKRR